MPVKKYQINSGLVRAAFIAVGAAAVVGAFFVVKWGLAHTAAVQSDNVEVASLSADLAPDDPQTHYALAILSEKTFAPGDIERALREFEWAASLSPNNYLLWLDLGRARERNGDRAGAELALRKALELAPSYSRVQWALGNVLLRQGRTDEAFIEIRKAVAGDASYTDAAINTAWQIFDGDLVLVRNAIGDSDRSNAALSILLAGQKRFDEAFDIWDRLPTNGKKTTLKEIGQTLYRQLFEGGKYRMALRVGDQIKTETSGPESIATVVNSGFEDALAVQNTNTFAWQVADGFNPRIGPTDGQKHSGKYSLLMSFGQGSKAIRTMSQTFAAEPGESYVLEFYYRSDIKTQSKLKWEIVAAATGAIIAATDTLPNVSDWTAVRTNFVVPAEIDGLVIRLAAENCDPANCAISGNIWFDDFSLKSQ